MDELRVSAMNRTVISLVVLLWSASLPVYAAGDAAHGEQLYEARCTACHSLDANRVGPMHRGVFARKAGSVPDFDYSPAVKKSKIVWTEKTLDQWLTNPEKLITGQKMSLQVSDAADRTDLIAFLKRESRK